MAVSFEAGIARRMVIGIGSLTVLSGNSIGWAGEIEAGSSEIELARRNSSVLPVARSSLTIADGLEGEPPKNTMDAAVARIPVIEV